MRDRTDEPFQNQEELLKQLADTKLKLALLMQQQEETERLLAAGDEAAMKEEDSFFASTQGRTLAHIRAQLRRQRARRLLRRDLPRVIRAAAAVLLVFCIGLTTAVAASPSLRVSLMRMLYHVEKQYTEVSFQSDESASVDVPPDWVNSYFMSYIPDGYKFILCSEPTSFDQEIIYENSEGKLLRFWESSFEMDFNIDTEGFAVSPIQISGFDGFIAVSSETTKIVWPTTDRCLTVIIDASAEEAIRIAEKVVRVK